MYIVEAMNQLCKVATSPCPLTIPARPSIRRVLDRSSARVKWVNSKFFLVKPALVQSVWRRSNKVVAATRYSKLVSVVHTACSDTTGGDSGVDQALPGIQQVVTAVWIRHYLVYNTRAEKQTRYYLNTKQDC
jgi:hypothetical protein